MTLIPTSRIILDLCGGTGSWSKPYKEAGYDVRVVTTPELDVRFYEYAGASVWGVLAAPPCTVFAASGARWKRSEQDMLDGLSVVDACLRIILITKPRWWVLENPVGKLRRWIGAPKMYFHPCDYGDPYKKKTCLWGKFNDPKKTPVKPTENPIYLMPDSKAQSIKRSITPPGFAKAFFEANP